MKDDDDGILCHGMPRRSSINPKLLLLIAEKNKKKRKLVLSSRSSSNEDKGGDHNQQQQPEELIDDVVDDVDAYEDCRSMTQAESEIYNRQVLETGGFDVDVLPGVGFYGLIRPYPFFDKDPDVLEENIVYNEKHVHLSF